MPNFKANTILEHINRNIYQSFETCFFFWLNCTDIDIGIKYNTDMGRISIFYKKNCGSIWIDIEYRIWVREPKRGICAS